MASQLLGIKTRFTNDLGSPLVGGQVYTYFAGTSTNQDSYSDASLTVPNTNPVILDDTGSADIFLKGSYRIRVFDASGRFIEEQDNVTQAASQVDATELTNKISAVEVDLSKVKLDTGITVTAKFGGVERDQSEKNTDILSINDLPSAETLNKNLTIDLLGKAIAMPNEQNKYVNGYVEKVDHLIWRGNYQTPFGKANIKTVVSSNDAHFGFNNGIADVSDGSASHWICVYRRSRGHEVTNGSQIWACDSYDCGQTWVNHRTIFRDENSDVRNFVFNKMGGSRAGLLATRRNADSTYGDAVFVYSDDAGVTWQSVDIATDGVTVNFHGALLNRPASVGGHDDNGWIGYSYGHDRGISAFYTNDNGNTWTVKHKAADIGDGELVRVLSECAVARISDEDKWVMVCRNANVAQGQDTNAVSFVSDDMLNFSNPTDTGVLLRNNPPQLIYDWGKLWLIGFSRKEREIIPNQSSHIVVASAPAHEVFESGGSFGDAKWQVVTSVPDWAAGYLHAYKINQQWFATFVCSENSGRITGGVKRNLLCMIGDFTPLSINHVDVMQLAPRRSENVNGQLQLWSHGTNTAVSGTSPVEVADNWFGAAARDEQTRIRQTAIDMSNNTLSPTPSYSIKMSGTASVAGTHYLKTQVHDIRRFSNRTVTLSFWAKGVGDIAQVRFYSRYDSSSNTDDVEIPLSDLELSQAEWRRFETQIKLDSLINKDVGDGDTFDINFYASSGGYSIEITNVKFEDSPISTPILSVSKYEEQQRLKQ